MYDELGRLPLASAWAQKPSRSRSREVVEPHRIVRALCASHDVLVALLDRSKQRQTNTADVRDGVVLRVPHSEAVTARGRNRFAHCVGLEAGGTGVQTLGWD